MQQKISIFTVVSSTVLCVLNVFLVYFSMTVLTSKKFLHQQYMHVSWESSVCSCGSVSASIKHFLQL